VITTSEELMSRVGETTVSALNYKVSKCYQIIESLLEHKNLQINENNKVSECIDEIDKRTSEHFESHALLINHIQDSMDKCLDRVARLENFMNKVVEQNKKFNEQLAIITHLCHMIQSSATEARSITCPSCKGRGEVLNNNGGTFRNLNILYMRKDMEGNTYEYCNTCKGSGVIIK
jgi:hypothetical protein